MASPLAYTLVSDGPSDRALLPIVDWVLQSTPAVAERGIERNRADPRDAGKGQGLAGRIRVALRQYPCDLLFVHRDAESSEPGARQKRCAEVEEAMAGQAVRYVSVVPIRMTEAWLLIDAAAIRMAADNPRSQAQIDLPPVRRLEQVPDPKELLRRLLVDASELKGRRRDRFQRDLSW